MERRHVPRRGGACQVGKRIADRRDRNRLPDRLALRPVEQPAERSEPCLLLDHLLGNRGVHVIDVGNAPAEPEPHREEHGFLPGVNHIVPAAGDQAAGHPEHGEVGDQLLPGQAGTQRADPFRDRSAMDRHAGILPVLSLAVDDQVDGIPALAQRAYQDVDIDGTAAIDIVGMRRQNQDGEPGHPSG